MSRIVTELPFEELVAYGESGDVGPGTLYPIGLPLAMLAKWVLQVKEWEVSVKIVGGAASAAGGASQSASVSIPDPIEHGVTPIAASEVHQAMGGKRRDGNGGDSDIDTASAAGGFAQASFSVSSEFTLFGDFADARIIYYDGLYWPQLFYHLAVNISALSNSSSPSGSSSKEQDIAAGNDVVGTDDATLTIEGVSVPIQAAFGVVGGSDIGSGASTSLSTPTSIDIVISAKEYWPYDPGDGDGPIWDTSTGAKLRQNYTS